MIGFSVLRKLQTRAIGDRWLRICTFECPEFRPLNMFHSPQNRSNRSACDWPPSSPRMSNTRGGGSSTTLFSSLFSSSTTFLVSSSLVNAFSRALTAFFVLVHHVVLQSRLQLPPPATVSSPVSFSQARCLREFAHGGLLRVAQLTHRPPLFIIAVIFKALDRLPKRQRV